MCSLSLFASSPILFKLEMRFSPITFVLTSSYFPIQSLFSSSIILLLYLCPHVCHTPTSIVLFSVLFPCIYCYTTHMFIPHVHLFHTFSISQIFQLIPSPYHDDDRSNSHHFLLSVFPPNSPFQNIHIHSLTRQFPPSQSFPPFHQLGFKSPWTTAYPLFNGIEKPVHPNQTTETPQRFS